MDWREQVEVLRVVVGVGGEVEFWDGRKNDVSFAVGLE